MVGSALAAIGTHHKYYNIIMSDFEPLDFQKEGIVLDYKTAGVDIDAGNKFVEDLKTKVPNLGGFGGMIKVPSGYEEPILVSGTDGVGTKIDIAQAAGDYTTIGIDLVAMCVNDIITCGAKPLYFLDYISTQKLDDKIPDIMTGITVSYTHLTLPTTPYV